MNYFTRQDSDVTLRRAPRVGHKSITLTQVYRFTQCSPQTTKEATFRLWSRVAQQKKEFLCPSFPINRRATFRTTARRPSPRRYLAVYTLRVASLSQVLRKYIVCIQLVCTLCSICNWCGTTQTYVCDAYVFNGPTNHICTFKRMMSNCGVWSTELTAMYIHFFTTTAFARNQTITHKCLFGLLETPLCGWAAPPMVQRISLQLGAVSIIWWVAFARFACLCATESCAAYLEAAYVPEMYTNRELWVYLIRRTQLCLYIYISIREPILQFCDFQLRFYSIRLYFKTCYLIFYF